MRLRSVDGQDYIWPFGRALPLGQYSNITVFYDEIKKAQDKFTTDTLNDYLYALDRKIAGDGKSFLVEHPINRLKE